METESIADLTIGELSENQSRQLDKKSRPFLGKWNRLISTTNWEKGAIIVQWRQELAQSTLPKSCYSDDAWSQLAGGSTPQHIGRLRRTYQRFGHVYNQYDGLYWSHFYAALDWPDAEMWLEGSLQNSWSVSQMRTKRWETMGSKPEDEPKVEQIVVSEIEEESRALGDSGKASIDDPEYIAGPRAEDPDFGDEPSGRSAATAGEMEDSHDSSILLGDKIRPFESFENLPSDIQSATNAFKVAIIRHKSDGWREISLQDLGALLDALKALATSASE